MTVGDFTDADSALARGTWPASELPARGAPGGLLEGEEIRLLVRKLQFAHDSALEGDGFELPVPREKARYPIGAQLILLWLQPRV